MRGTNAAHLMKTEEANKVLAFRPVDQGFQLSLEKVSDEVTEGRSRLRLILSRSQKDDPATPPVEEIFGGAYADRIEEQYCRLLYDLIKSAEEFRRGSVEIIQYFREKLEGDKE